MKKQSNQRTRCVPNKRETLNLQKMFCTLVSIGWISLLILEMGTVSGNNMYNVGFGNLKIFYDDSQVDNKETGVSRIKSKQ